MKPTAPNTGRKVLVRGLLHPLRIARLFAVLVLVLTVLLFTGLLAGCGAIPVGEAESNAVSYVEEGGEKVYPEVEKKLLSLGDKRIRQVKAYWPDEVYDEDKLFVSFAAVDVSTSLRAGDADGVADLLLKVFGALEQTYPGYDDVYVSFFDAAGGEIDLAAAATEVGVRFVQDEGKLGVRVNEQVLRLLAPGR